MTNTPLKAPFPYFGGKAKIASVVWEAIGDVDNYVEPFAGSAAVLLARPVKRSNSSVETINDLNCMVVNLWRAIKNDPVGVAVYCNDPPSEADLIARHIWLVNEGEEIVANVMGDPTFFDVKTAGWYLYAASTFFGHDLCMGNGGWTSVDGKLVHARVEGKKGVSRRRIQLGNTGVGIHRSSLFVGEIADGTETGLREIVAYIKRLAARLRHVRICNGDWKRVVTDGALAHGKTVGIFLDPPYEQSVRYRGLYKEDKPNLSTEVREWCIEHQDDPRLRIVLAGYEGEHEMPPEWRVISWKANRSYGNSGGDTDNSINRTKERLWISPNCLMVASATEFQMQLF